MDVAKTLEAFVKDINYTLNSILKPLYNQMYEHSENSETLISTQMQVAQNALFKAGALL